MNGRMPHEGDFSDLIDSAVNKVDDGISKDMEHGLMLSPEGSSQKLLSFFRSIEDKASVWNIGFQKENEKSGLAFSEPAAGDQPGGTRLFLQQGGNVGIGTTDPKYPLHVKGFSGMEGRVGTAYFGEVLANGQWQTIIPNLNHAQAFEIVARVGEKGSGRHSLLHAIAVSAYGNSWNQIRVTRGQYSFWRPAAIRLRWRGTTYNYRLEARTRKKFPKDVKIKFYISRLWGDEELEEVPVRSAKPTSELPPSDSGK